jgi:hypothetical protein
MPKGRSVTLQIQCEQNSTSSESFQLKEWEKSDGVLRAALSALAVVVIAALMLPIPIVHFAAIPVLLFGLPLAGVITFKMYSKGTDLRGTLSCPECGATRMITRSVAYWPLSLQCLGCKKHMTIILQSSE